MPLKVYVVDLRKERTSGGTPVLSAFLEHKIEETLAKKEQIVLFLNKRGHGGQLLCKSCGVADECPHCAVSYTIHKHPSRGHTFLLCHYCGKVSPIPPHCPSCHAEKSLIPIGVGTQQVEEYVQSRFPKARIGRMDQDSMSRKHAHKELYAAMEQGKLDILIGTQMVAKGLDLPNVSLVGIVQADMGLHLPDFRAGERTFQLLTQVIGRGGRRGQEGSAIIQTYRPEHPVIQFAARQDYEGFFQYTYEERKTFQFPPFTECVRCTFAHKDQTTAYNKAQEKYAEVKEIIKELHPKNEVFLTPALISKAHGLYYYCLFFKGENLAQLFDRVTFSTGWRVDVDPNSL